MAVSSSAVSALTTGPVTVRFDGSVRDATHHESPSAAVGYVIEDVSAGSQVVQSSRRLDNWVSNTHVEFDALLAALDHLLDLGYTGHIYVCGDSKSVIELTDPNKHSTPNDSLMAHYVRQARARLDEFESFTLNYVLRKNNTEADRLAAEGHYRESLHAMP